MRDLAPNLRSRRRQQFTQVRAKEFENPLAPEVGLRMDALWNTIVESDAKDGRGNRCFTIPGTAFSIGRSSGTRQLEDHPGLCDRKREIMKKTAVVGLGNMGIGMAKNLIAAGFPVQGFDLRPERLDLLAELGGSLAAAWRQPGRLRRIFRSFDGTS